MPGCFSAAWSGPGPEALSDRRVAGVCPESMPVSRARGMGSWAFPGEDRKDHKLQLPGRLRQEGCRFSATESVQGGQSNSASLSQKSKRRMRQESACLACKRPWLRPSRHQKDKEQKEERIFVCPTPQMLEHLLFQGTQD